MFTSSPSRFIGSTLNVIPSISPTPRSGFLAPFTLRFDAVDGLLDSSAVTKSLFFKEKEEENVLRAMGDTDEENNSLGLIDAHTKECDESDMVDAIMMNRNK